MKKLLFLLLLILVRTSFARIELCPTITPVQIAPKYNVKVTYDEKTSQYRYSYKISNLTEAKSAIWRVSLEAYSAPVSSKAGTGWISEGYRPEYNEIFFQDKITLGNVPSIKPGQSLDGFEVISKAAPGQIRIYSEGEAEVPTIKFGTEEEAKNGDDESIICPGFFMGGGLHYPQVVSVVTGPSILGRVEAKVRIKKISEKRWNGGQSEEPISEISPVDTGKIQLILFGDGIVDVEKIALSSLELGRGKAKPLRTQILGDFKDDVDDEIKNHLKKYKAKFLLMEFNLQDVDVKCDIDRSLFLSGKIGSKDLLSAVRIKPVVCDKKTFSREAKKIEKHFDSE